MARICLSAGFSGTALKRIAAAAMLVDHIGAVCLWRGVLLPWPGIEQGIDALRASSAAFAAWYWFYYALRLVGRLAFPLYCFLLAEGFVHTRSTPRYAARLLSFALLSEAPCDFAVTGSTFYPDAQNVYFTLFLGLCAVWAMQRLPGKPAQLFALALLATAAELLHTDYGAMGVALIAVFWYFRTNAPRRDLFAILLTAGQMTAPLALLLIQHYNGSRGNSPRWETHFHYLFYPAHLLALALLTQYILY